MDDPRRNVELKARERSRAASLDACAELGARDGGELWQRDTYFAVPCGRLKLREQRPTGDGPGNAELIQYARDDAAVARDSRYRVVEVPDPEALRAALADALGVRVEVVKRRRLWLWESVRIHLDTVEGFGEFVELESVVAPGEDDAVHHRRVTFLRERLGIRNEDLLAVGYADLVELARRLASEGFVAAGEEAAELLAAAAGDAGRLEELVQRRLTGEPLAWITGTAVFCGITLGVDPGVYVPRWQSEQLAERAAQRLPPGGTAIDLCTGSGAVARTLLERRPGARVLATDLEPRAVACARANGVEAFEGDLFGPLPDGLEGRVDVVVAVVPYVPTPELPLLQRDTFTFESPLAYDGGADGTDVLRRVIAESPRLLRPGGALLLELGGDESDALRDALARHGFADVAELRDEDGDLRGIEAALARRGG